MNCEQLLEKARLHRQQNIEYYREYNKHYRENNDIQLQTKARKMIECECGCIVRNDCLVRHTKSLKHIKLMRK